MTGLPATLRADTHVHSAFSVDSQEPLPAMCDAAIRRGLTTICFVEHVDLDPRDIGYGFFRWEAYRLAVDDARRAYGGQLEILRGVELGEPHRYPRELEALGRLDLDVIVGAVHWLPEGFVGERAVRQRLGLRGLYERYYGEVLAAVGCGGFDVLAHLDLPKRYAGASHDDPLVDDVLAELVRAGIALEVNTSPLRKGLAECSPDLDILERYARLGGGPATVGSDAHSGDEVGAGIERAEGLLREAGLAPAGVYRGRRFPALT